MVVEDDGEEKGFGDGDGDGAEKMKDHWRARWGWGSEGGLYIIYI